MINNLTVSKATGIHRQPAEAFDGRVVNIFHVPVTLSSIF